MTEPVAATSTEGRSKKPLFIAAGVVVGIVVLIFAARFPKELSVNIYLMMSPTLIFPGIP